MALTYMHWIFKKLFGGDHRPKRYGQLFDTIKEIRPKTIMEIGTWTGDRAIQMIETSKTFYPAAQIQYFGFDLFDDLTEETFSQEISKKPPSMSEVKKKLEATGAQISLYKGNTVETIKPLVTQLPKMDFIFIDGGHSLATIESDWENSKAVLDKNGVVIFDDYWENRVDAGAKKTVESIRNDTSFEVNLMPISDHFNNPDFGELSIHFAKVHRNPESV